MNAGGKFDSQVKKTTKYLLAGEDPGDKKVADARKSGAEIIKWEEFLRLIS